MLFAFFLSFHALWYCKAAQQIWKHTFLCDVYKKWLEANFQDLFAHVAHVFSKEELDLFAVVRLGGFGNSEMRLSLVKGSSQVNR